MLVQWVMDVHTDAVRDHNNGVDAGGKLLAVSGMSCFDTIFRDGTIGVHNNKDARRDSDSEDNSSNK